MIRTRFAPSPTGSLHVGGVRTALFAWAYAKSRGGTFILRIEDTDKSREVKGSVDHIIESLQWLGIDIDEGPQQGGSYGPYIQSERLDVYRKHAEQLVAQGLAYVDRRSVEELDALKKQSAQKIFLYRDHRPDQPVENSDWYGKYALRFRVPQVKRYSWTDAVRGELSAGEDALDDFIIIKKDGFPTYNFAHIIDDDEMDISHVIRGEEFISSMPKYLSVMEALRISRPVFVTVPPILGASGGKKLSKRDGEGARDVLYYRDKGYLPEAVVNFLALLGWNDGTQKEIFTVAEFVEAFSLERIQRHGARFDENKLEWIQWQHCKLLVEHDAIQLLSRLSIERNDLSDDTAIKAAQLVATKAASVAEFRQQYAIFTHPATIAVNTQWLHDIDSDLSAKRAGHLLTAAIEAINHSDGSAESVETELRNAVSQTHSEPRTMLNLVRWAVSRQRVSPNLFAMINLLGSGESIRRIEQIQMQLTSSE